MNIDKRLVKALRYLKKNGVTVKPTSPYKCPDFEQLVELHYVDKKDVCIPQGLGEAPLTLSGYEINKSGLDFLKHYTIKTWATHIGAGLTLAAAIISAIMSIIR